MVCTQRQRARKLGLHSWKAELCHADGGHRLIHAQSQGHEDGQHVHGCCRDSKWEEDGDRSQRWPQKLMAPWELAEILGRVLDFLSFLEKVYQTLQRQGDHIWHLGFYLLSGRTHHTNLPRLDGPWPGTNLSLRWSHLCNVIASAAPRQGDLVGLLRLEHSGHDGHHDHPTWHKSTWTRRNARKSPCQSWNWAGRAEQGSQGFCFHCSTSVELKMYRERPLPTFKWLFLFIVLSLFT